MIDTHMLYNTFIVIIWLLLIFAPFVRFFEVFKDNTIVASILSLIWAGFITLWPGSPFNIIVEWTIDLIMSSIIWIILIILAIFGVLLLFGLIHSDQLSASTPDISSEPQVNSGETDTLVDEVVEKILEFEYKPPRRKDISGEREEDYHRQLWQWLKHDFPNATYDTGQRGSARPDIVINDVGIEVKGPTTKRSVNDIPQKLLRYGESFEPEIVVVLFNLQFKPTSSFFMDFLSGVKKKHPKTIIIIEADGILKRI